MPCINYDKRRFREIRSRLACVIPLRIPKEVTIDDKVKVIARKVDFTGKRPKGDLQLYYLPKNPDFIKWGVPPGANDFRMAWFEAYARIPLNSDHIVRHANSYLKIKYAISKDIETKLLLVYDKYIGCLAGYDPGMTEIPMSIVKLGKGVSYDKFIGPINC